MWSGPKCGEHVMDGAASSPAARSHLIWVVGQQLSPDPVACRWPAEVIGTHTDTLRDIEDDVEKGTKLFVKFLGTGEKGYPKYLHRDVRADASATLALGSDACGITGH